MPLPINVQPHHSSEWYASLLNWIHGISIDKWQKFVQIIAIIVGGIGAYIRWFKGRAYSGRLESTVTPTAEWKGECCYINVAVSIKNIGLTKLNIHQTGTALRLCQCETLTDTSEVVAACWEHLGTFPIFENDSFIESGETIRDQLMVVVPNRNIHSFQLELNVCAGKGLWLSRAIVTPEEKPKLPRRRIILE